MRLRTLGMILILASSASAQLPVGKNAPIPTPPAAVPLVAQGVPLDAGIAKNSEMFLREFYAWGRDVQVQFTSVKDAPITGFDEVRVQVTVNGGIQGGDLYISKDGKYIIQGNISPIVPDPFAENRKLLDTADSPSLGPATASVTVVEFSDFQCPHCRAFAQALKTIQSKYPQVRFVFKNYPLEKIHPWAMTAAIAARCAYKSSNDAFWKLTDTIFQNQDTIKAETATDQLKGDAASAGVPADAYASCMVDPGTKGAIERDVAEGTAVHVESTPTVFVNGHPVNGGDPQLVVQYIQYELDKATAPAPTLAPVPK